MWLGISLNLEDGEQNLIFLHHCEGAPGPDPGEIIAEVTGHPGQFWYKSALKNNNNNNRSVCIERVLIPTCLLSAIPGFLLVLSVVGQSSWLPELFKCSSWGHPDPGGDTTKLPAQTLGAVSLAVVTQKILLSLLSPGRGPGLPAVIFSTPAILGNVSGSS